MLSFVSEISLLYTYVLGELRLAGRQNSYNEIICKVSIHKIHKTIHKTDKVGTCTVKTRL